MKKITLLILALLLTLSLTLPAFAVSSYVVDQANLLTDDEKSQLEDKLEAISRRQKADIVVVTVKSLNGAYIRDYADDYYDDHGYRDDGILLLVTMDEREYWVSTTGRCISEITVSDLEDGFLDPLSEGDYYGAFCEYADACESELEGLPLIVKLLICLGIGLLVGLITVLVMKGKLKTVRCQSGADSYMRYDDVHVTQRSDIFLYQTVSRRPKPQNNGGSHMGSSGRSHGGGGGRF